MQRHNSVDEVHEALYDLLPVPLALSRVKERRVVKGEIREKGEKVAPPLGENRCQSSLLCGKEREYVAKNLVWEIANTIHVSRQTGQSFQDFH